MGISRWIFYTIEPGMILPRIVSDGRLKQRIFELLPRRYTCFHFKFKCGRIAVFFVNHAILNYKLKSRSTRDNGNGNHFHMKADHKIINLIRL